MSDDRRPLDQEVDSIFRMARESSDFFEGLVHQLALPPAQPQTVEPQSKEPEPISIQ
jgi:hypothetical protein